MEQKVYTLQEAAELLRMSEHTIYMWCRSGKLKAYKPGRKWLIPSEAIDQILSGDKDDEQR